MTSPPMPPSPMTRSEPRPTRKQGEARARAKRTTPRRVNRSYTSANMSAGPPTRIVVNGAKRLRRAGLESQPPRQVSARRRVRSGASRRGDGVAVSLTPLPGVRCSSVAVSGSGARSASAASSHAVAAAAPGRPRDRAATAIVASWPPAARSAARRRLSRRRSRRRRGWRRRRRPSPQRWRAGEPPRADRAPRSWAGRRPSPPPASRSPPVPPAGRRPRGRRPSPRAGRRRVGSAPAARGAGWPAATPRGE